MLTITKSSNKPTVAKRGTNNFPPTWHQPPTKPVMTDLEARAAEDNVNILTLCYEDPNNPDENTHDEITGTDGAGWGFYNFPAVGTQLDVDPWEYAKTLSAQFGSQASWEVPTDQIYSALSGKYIEVDEAIVCSMIHTCSGQVQPWGSANPLNMDIVYGKHCFMVARYYLSEGNTLVDAQYIQGTEVLFSQIGVPSPISMGEVAVEANAPNAVDDIYAMSNMFSYAVTAMTGLSFFTGNNGQPLPDLMYTGTLSFGLDDFTKQVFWQVKGGGPGPGPGPKPPMGFIDPLQANTSLPPWRSVVPFANYTFPIKLIKRN